MPTAYFDYEYTWLSRHLPWPATNCFYLSGVMVYRLPRWANADPGRNFAAYRRPMRLLTDPAATAQLLARSMVGYDLLLVGDLGSCVRASSSDMSDISRTSQE